MHGILNLHKPAGPTSHDCVARVRRVFGVRRVGHAGTLDPLASGVLVVGIGHGTRILEYLQDHPKVYRARLALGVETDTQDLSGRVLAESDASGIDSERFQAVLDRFRGEILQTPPMFSAVKVGGRKLYELARRGEEISRQPRPVTVYSLECLSFEAGARAEAEIRVRCSAGTYIRTLCHDIGRALGTGAAMGDLVREAVGPMTVGDAALLSELSPSTPVLSLSEALAHLPAVRLEPAEAARLASGQFIPTPEETPDGPLRVLGPTGELLAIAVARGHGTNRLLSPVKVFPPDDRGDASGSGS